MIRRQREITLIFIILILAAFYFYSKNNRLGKVESLNSSVEKLSEKAQWNKEHYIIEVEEDGNIIWGELNNK